MANSIRGTACRLVVGVAVFAAVVSSATACSAAGGSSDTIEKLRDGGFASRAEEVCTTSGSIQFKLSGSTRLVAASDSTIGQARALVTQSAQNAFATDTAGKSSTSYVALCFVQTPSAEAPPNGHAVIAQFPGATGDVLIANW
jgi:hypothetical protein